MKEGNSVVAANVPAPAMTAWSKRDSNDKPSVERPGLYEVKYNNCGEYVTDKFYWDGKKWMESATSRYEAYPSQFRGLVNPA